MAEASVRVAYSLLGAQISSNAKRGIGRYVREHTEALRRIPTVQLEEVVDPDLPMPTFEFARSQMVTTRRVDHPVDFMHITSAIENMPLSKILPMEDPKRKVKMSLLVFDLIPLREQERYFVGPLRRLYRSRLELMRSVDLLFAISETTRQDLIQFLDVNPQKVVSIDGGCSPIFSPVPENRKSNLFSQLQQKFPSIKPNFIYFAGNVDPRKNIESTLYAYSFLGEEFRSRHQLLLSASQGSPEFSRHLKNLCQRLGIENSTLIVEYVDEETLLLLYRLAWIFVFPSLFEGLGLPIIEAQSCGTPVLCSDRSSMRSLVKSRLSLVNPFSPRAIADRLQMFENNPDVLELIRNEVIGESKRFSWSRTAALTVDAWLAANERIKS